VVYGISVAEQIFKACGLHRNDGFFFFRRYGHKPGSRERIYVSLRFDVHDRAVFARTFDHEAMDFFGRRLDDSNAQSLEVDSLRSLRALKTERRESGSSAGEFLSSSLFDRADTLAFCILT
jgi:hypothetical protein